MAPQPHRHGDQTQMEYVAQNGIEGFFADGHVVGTQKATHNRQVVTELDIFVPTAPNNSSKKEAKSGHNGHKKNRKNNPQQGTFCKGFKIHIVLSSQISEEGVFKKKSDKDITTAETSRRVAMGGFWKGYSRYRHLSKAT